MVPALCAQVGQFEDVIMCTAMEVVHAGNFEPDDVLFCLEACVQSEHPSAHLGSLIKRS